MKIVCVLFQNDLTTPVDVFCGISMNKI